MVPRVLTACRITHSDSHDQMPLMHPENKNIYTTIGEACVCVCAKFDQFLPVRPHFDTKRPVNFFHIATFPSPTFGPLFAFHCPLFFTKNNNLHAAMF